MAVAPDVYVFGKFNNVVSVVATTPQLDQGTAEWALCGYGSQIPRIPGQALVSLLTQPIPANTSEQDAGTFSAYLYNNLLIAPSGTYYTLTVRNANGDIAQVNAYRFTAPGSFEIDGLVPYDPNQPPPGLPPLILNLLLIVPYSPNPVFPGDQYASWQITLNGDATATFTNLVDGNLYTIIIVQDATGEHNFNWPLNVYNPTLVYSNPNGMTVQTFVAVSDQLYPIGAGTYYP